MVCGSMACQELGGAIVKPTLHKFMLEYVRALNLSDGRDEARCFGFYSTIEPYHKLRTALEACGHDTRDLQTAIFDAKSAILRLHAVAEVNVKNLELVGFAQADKTAEQT